MTKANEVTVSRRLRAMFIDMAYTWAMIQEKSHIAFLGARHGTDLIEEVWSVHPAADVTSTITKPIEIRHPLARHVLLESCSGEKGRPGFIWRLVRFLLSQTRLLRVLIRVVRDRQIDLIVTGDPFYTALLAILLRGVTGVPVVVCAMGNYDRAFRTVGELASPRLIPSYRLQRWVTRYTLTRADHVVVGCRDDRDYVLAYGASPERTSIVLPIANLSVCHFVAPEERNPAIDFFATHGIPKDANCMIFVGRLISLKYPDDAVKAMIKVVKHDSRAYGIVAGAGSLADELHSMVTKAGLADRIIFAGNLKQQLLSEILPRCVTISPLTGMALLESGFAGSPIVAFNINVQAELVANYENGFLVEFHDIQSMADRVCEIFADDALRTKLSTGSRAKAIAFADMAHFNRVRHDAYHMAITHARGRGFSRKPQASL
jgi:glycosyltransferase involved in cell wall biosynthesis